MAIRIPILVEQTDGHFLPVGSLSAANFTFRLDGSTSTTVSYSYFSDEGNGNYVFGNFAMPSASAQGALVQLAINNTLRPEFGTHQIWADGDHPYGAAKIENSFWSSTGDTVSGTHNVSGSLISLSAYIDQTSPMFTNNAPTNTAYIWKSYADGIYATTGSVSGFVGSLTAGIPTLSGNNSWTGTNVFNNNLSANNSLVWSTANTWDLKGSSMNLKNLTLSSATATQSFIVKTDNTNRTIFQGPIFTDSDQGTHTGITIEVNSDEKIVFSAEPGVIFSGFPGQGGRQTDTVSERERIFDCLKSISAQVTNKLYNNWTDLNNSTFPSNGDEYTAVIKSNQYALSGNDAVPTLNDYLNVRGDGNARSLLYENTYSSISKWSNFRVLSFNKDVEFTNMKFENMYIGATQKAGTSNGKITFAGNCELVNCIMSSVTAIDFVGGTNKIINCYGTHQSITSAGDLYVGYTIDPSLSAVTF